MCDRKKYSITTRLVSFYDYGLHPAASDTVQDPTERERESRSARKELGCVD